MARSDTFHCSLITPERTLIECDATFAAFPAHDGEMGVLRNRAPLLCKLGTGIVRLREGSTDHRFLIDGGFAQVLENQLTILTQYARKFSELDAAAAERMSKEAAAMKITDDVSRDARTRARLRAAAAARLVAEPQ
jgi:F-type H+-transporting ATPase subunit epsilon